MLVFLQGWLALVSNLEETVSRFVRRADKFCVQSDKFLQNREKASQLLIDFNNDLQLLTKVCSVSVSHVARGALIFTFHAGKFFFSPKILPIRSGQKVFSHSIPENLK